MAMSTSANIFNVETELKMISMGRKGIEWTVTMIEKMLAEYAITFDRILAEELHVSINSVRREAKKLQLSKQYKGRKNMVARKIVQENFHVMSYQQLARLARIDIRSVVNIVIEYNLSRTEEEISWVRETLSSMTLTEKLSQLFVLLKAVPGVNEEQIKNQIYGSKDIDAQWAQCI